MARTKSAGGALKGAHQLLAPADALSARQRQVVDQVAAGQAKKQAKQRKTKRSEAARARRSA